MRASLRPFAVIALTLLGACGSITDPTSPSALAARRPPKPPPPKTPILFVHGYNSSATIWSTIIGRFKNDGWTASQLSSFSYNTNVSNATTATIIAGKVDSIRTATGSAHVAIVGHSMGTLSARYYLKNLGGQPKVSALVSLAGANHGTNIAIFCSGAVSCQEMIPGSPFLTALNADDETPGLVNYRTWWSNCDEVISPRTSMLLSGATNTQTACLTHSAMYTDATVYGQVRDFVNKSAPALFIAAR